MIHTLRIKKTRTELTKSLFLSKSEIATLLDVPRPVADRIYALAETVDNSELKFRVYDTKVTAKSVCTVVGIEHSDLVNDSQS